MTLTAVGARRVVAGLITAVAAASVPAPSRASDCEPVGCAHFYAGAAGGMSRYDENLSAEMNSAWANVGGRTPSLTVEDRDGTAWQVFAGWRFHENFALEAGWYDFGKMTSRLKVRETLYDGTLTHQVAGGALSLAGSLPVATGLTLYGRLGALAARTKYREQGVAVFDFTETQRVDISRTDHQVVPLFGLAIGYAITPQVEARLDWTRAAGIGKAWTLDRGETGELDVDAFTAQVVVRF